MKTEHFFLKIDEKPLNKKPENPTDQISFCIVYGILKPASRIETVKVHLQSTVDLLQNNPLAATISLLNQSDCLGIDLTFHARLIALIVSHLVLVINSESGLPSSLIFRVLNVKVYHSLKPVKDEVMEDVCSICLEDIDKYGACTRCRHVFHGDCITKWLDKSNQCPLCRFDMGKCSYGFGFGPFEMDSWSWEAMRKIIIQNRSFLREIKHVK